MIDFYEGNGEKVLSGVGELRHNNASHHRPTRPSESSTLSSGPLRHSMECRAWKGVREHGRRRQRSWAVILVRHKNCCACEHNFALECGQNDGNGDLTPFRTITSCSGQETTISDQYSTWHPRHAYVRAHYQPRIIQMCMYRQNGMRYI